MMEFLCAAQLAILISHFTGNCDHYNLNFHIWIYQSLVIPSSLLWVLQIQAFILVSGNAVGVPCFSQETGLIPEFALGFQAAGGRGKHPAAEGHRGLAQGFQGGAFAEVMVWFQLFIPPLQKICGNFKKSCQFAG